LAIAAKGEVGLTFVPHLVPMIRGMYATLYAPLIKESVDLQALFENYYKNAIFVDVMPEGAHPETRSVSGANVCRLAVHQPKNSKIVVVLSAIDNLMKGAAGQAVQNFNIMFDLDESAGLVYVPLLP